MRVIDLIKELEKLPKDATIGSFDIEDAVISQEVVIYSKESIVYGEVSRMTMKEIEDFRHSNKDKKCDYYIGY